jgi:hypothetical protein
MDPVQQLLEIEAIKTLKARYFRLMDAQEWSAFGELLTPDLEICFCNPDQPHPPGATTTAEGYAMVGKEALLAWTEAGSRGCTTVHHAHMPDIELTGPETAIGQWSMTDYTRWNAVEPPVWVRGYGGHLEHYVRTPAGWRIRRSWFTRYDMDPMDGAYPTA